MPKVEQRRPSVSYIGKAAATDRYYKREVSLMDQKIFPRASLDKAIDNPDVENSISVFPVEKSDKEVVDNVVSALRKTGIK